MSETTTKQDCTPTADPVTTQPLQIANHRPSLLERAATSEGVAEYLNDTIDLIGEYLEGTNAVPAINALCEVWMQSPGVDLATDANRNHLRSVLHLTTFLIQLKSNYETLDLENERAEHQLTIPPILAGALLPAS